MPQQRAAHPLSKELPPPDAEVFASMWNMFVHIGKFWQNMDDPEPYRSNLYTFMENRISLRPIYQEYYSLAKRVMDELIASMGEDQAYAYLFTDADAAKSPPETPLAVTRQKVANELMALQLSVGGFKVWGALNLPSYIGGANIPGQPAPYRTFQGAQ